MRRLLCRLFILLGMVGFSGLAWAGVFTAEVDRTIGSVDDQFELTLTVSGKAEGEPRLPAIDGLRVESSGTSTNVQMSWGNYSKETLYRFLLSPTKAGKLVIPSLQLKVDGELLSTAPLTLTVSEAASGAEASGAPLEIFVERDFDRSEIYLGEAVVSTVRFFSRVAVGRASVSDNTPASIKRHVIKGEKNFSKEVNGQTYQVTEINEVLLPEQVGSIELSGYQIVAEVAAADTSRRQRGRGVFEDFFGGLGRAMVTRRATAPSKTIVVKPLPASGRSAKFSGLVGEFVVGASLAPSDIKVGETATLTLQIDGIGSVAGMPPPDLDLAAKAKVYADQPKISDQYTVAEGVQGHAEFKYAIVPLVDGDIDLGAVVLQIFNPRTGKYEDKKIALGKLRVTGSAAAASGAVAPSSQGVASEAPMATNADLVEPKSLASMKLTDDLTDREVILCLSAVGAFASLPLAVYFLLPWYRKRQGDVVSVRRATRQRQLLKYLAEWQPGTALDEAACARVGYMVRDYLGSCLQASGAALTDAEIIARLGDHPVYGRYAADATPVLQALERASYAGGALGAHDADKIRHSLQELLRVLAKVKA